MKNLRKWIALAAAMAMTATLLTGCGSSEAPASEAAASTADNSTAVATGTCGDHSSRRRAGSRCTGDRRQRRIKSRC